MKYPQYAEYRNSGIECLGVIPEQWVVSRLGYESWVRARLGWRGLKAEEYIDDGPILLSTPNIKGDQVDFLNVNCISQERYDESPEIKLVVGDVLLAKDGSTLGTVNVITHLPQKTTVNSSIAVITPRIRLHSLYLYYYLSSNYIQNLIQQLKGGMGVPHLFQDDINRFPLIIPALPVQESIVDFLRDSVVKINALIVEQEKLITLLKEKRQTVISHAVTKGLNPDAPMKDSGVEWLGMVPKEWDIVKFKHCAHIAEGLINPTERHQGEKILIAPDHVEKETGRILMLETAEQQGAISNKYTVSAG